MMMMMSQNSRKLKRLTSQMMNLVRRLGEENDDVIIIFQYTDQATRCTRKSYPHRRCESVEISLRDLDGRGVLLKENVIFSSKVNQPILCYGRLTKHGWGINSREQTSENGDLKVPLSLQNRSLTVQGRISRIRDESCLEVQVPEALEKESGWRFNEHGLLVGSLLISRFVDPTINPEVEESPELTRTALVKLDEQLFDDDAVVPSITNFSYEPAPPEDMGFFAPGYKKLGDGEQRRKEVQEAMEEITPTPQEKEVEGQREEEKKDEDLECELQLSSMDVDTVLVNGVELTKDSSLATLRQRVHFSAFQAVALY